MKYRLSQWLNSRSSQGVVNIVLGFILLMVTNSLLAQNTKTLDQLSMEERVERGKPFHAQHAETVEPFTIIGNVHYVGAKNIASYLITSDEGHFLLDSGVREMGETIQANIQKLGFDLGDIKILLSSHAHFDHVQGHEALRLATGAKVMAIGEDALALQEGKDLSPLGFEGWNPVKVDRVLEHGDVLTLGTTKLKAINVPGHTQGCTVWTMDVEESGSKTSLAFFGCSGPNNGVKIMNNKNFPNLMEDTLLGYSRLREINPDIYLNGHPHKLFESRMSEIRAGGRPHPLLTQQPWLEFVSGLENNFQKRIK